ncbi:phosphatase PAP2 family protein [bacterium]|nr:phosphatase PAP2 family protein [bacterium]
MIDVFTDDLRILGQDGLAYILAPLSFDSHDWIYAGGVLGVTGGLMLGDETWQEIPRSNQNTATLDVARTFDRGGHLPTMEIAAGATYLTGWLGGWEEVRVTGRLLLQSLIYSGITWYVVAVSAGRSRPSGHLGAYEFNPGQTDSNQQSIPSGHTNVAFSIATVLASRIDHWAASVLLYGAAAGVGLGRWYQDHHWASDVFLGAVIGYTAAKFAVHREEERMKKKGRPDWNLGLSPQGVSVQVYF